MDDHQDVSPVVEAALAFIDEFAAEFAVNLPLNNSSSSRQSTIPSSNCASLDGLTQEEDNGLESLTERTSNYINTVSRDSLKKSRRKQRRSDNPNFAREQQRKELRLLRIEAKDLEAQLTVIQQVRQGIVGLNKGTSDQTERSSLADIARGVWMATSHQQFVQRMKATKENERLKSLVETNFGVITKLQELLQQCSIDKTVCSMHPEVAASLRAYDSEILTKSILDQLVASTDNCYHQVDNIFSQCCVNPAEPSIQPASEMLVDTTGHLFSRVFGAKMLPFPLRETCPVVWNVITGCVRRSARCHFTHILHQTADTVVESCGTELFTEDSKSVVFHTRQIKRRYQEERREVIVWQSDVRPVQFGGRRLHGAAFKESGVFLIHRHPLIPSEFTLLQTCYLITPCTPMSELPKDAQAREVIDFVLKCMAASIPENHKVFENALLDHTLH